MQTEHWEKVKELLQDVLRLDASQREKFLDEADAGVEVRREVESLLAVEAEAADFMSLSANKFATDFFDENDDYKNSLINQKIGVYEIVRELGCGGMGAVYLGKRVDGKFEQQVAIKMLKRELNTEKIRRNFAREKQILAALAHPNIAALFDAGTTPDGVPYLVMECVEGEPIDEFCRSHQLSLNQRLKLFNKVCDAVAFAHRNLVIHRDLKPSNILVTKHGEPKLLDFGISKLLGVKSESSTTITNLGAMTPHYASPEQIKGESVTTATDVYGLGVVLFKLLTGNLPYNFSGNDVFKEITETTPKLPSEAALRSVPPAVAGGLFAARNPPATAGGTDLSHISASQLKGDLDNIVLKALRKEPERRYKSVEAFSADVWRFVDGMPVLARPATVWYRARKFYTRNRISVLAAGFILLSLFTGVGVAVSQANAAVAQAQIASHARTAAELETTRARAEQERAEKISLFMAKIIAYANPRWYAEGAKTKGEARVIDALLEMGDQIDREFPEHADVRAELHHKFAEAIGGYASDRISDPRASEDAKLRIQFHARRALELRRQFYGERHELVAKDLAYYYWTFPQEPTDAAKMLAEAIQMMRETNPKNLNLPYMLSDYAHRLARSDTKHLHEAYLQAAIPATDENKFQLAERYLKEALPIYREYYQTDNYAVILEECHLAYVQARQNKFIELQEHYQICKQAADKFDNKTQSDGIKRLVGEIEQIAFAR